MADHIESRMNFIIEQQAQFAADIQLLKERQADTQRMIEANTSMIRQLVDVTMSLARHGEETDRRLRELAESGTHTDRRLREIAESGAHTDHRLDAVIDSMAKFEETDRRLGARIEQLAEAQSHTDRHLRELAESGAHTDRRLDALIGTVDKLTRRDGPPLNS